MQDWQSNNAFRKSQRVSHGVMASVMAYRGYIHDILLLIAPSELCSKLTVRLLADFLDEINKTYR